MDIPVTKMTLFRSLACALAFAFLSAGPIASTTARAEVVQASVPDPTDDSLPRANPVKLQLNGDVLGDLSDYYTWKSDTLLDIARIEELGLVEVMAANPGVDPWNPGIGTHLVLPTAHVLPDAPRNGIVVNLAELRVYYYYPGHGVYTFPIGVGREGFGTPIGQTKIVRKMADPIWYPTAGKRADDPDLPAVVPPGPDNPLGEFALYLGWPTYLMHGTHKPWGVGRRVSRGCIRFYPEDIAWFFKNVPVGTPVTTVVQAVKLGWRDNQLYLEVHPSLDQIDQIEANGRAEPSPVTDQTERIITVAGTQSDRIDWDVVDKVLKERQGIPVRITK